MAGQKTFKQLYADLANTRRKIEEEQRHEEEIHERLRTVADDTFLAEIHNLYKSDNEIFELLRAIQNNEVKICFVSTEENNINDIGENN